MPSPPTSCVAAHVRRTPLRLELDSVDVVAIGASTGAPAVIEKMLAGLPADLAVPIVIAQHMPPNFTRAFATRLDQISPLSVFHAEGVMPLVPGSVYLAVGRRHIRVRRMGRTLQTEITDEPEHLSFRPSVDELFKSVSRVVGGRSLGIVLSGMGRDGVIGAALMKETGATLITQYASTCAVYGMPKSLDESDLTDASLEPELIRQTLLSFSPSCAGTVEVGR